MSGRIVNITWHEASQGVLRKGLSKHYCGEEKPFFLYPSRCSDEDPRLPIKRHEQEKSKQKCDHPSGIHMGDTHDMAL